MDLINMQSWANLKYAVTQTQNESQSRCTKYASSKSVPQNDYGKYHAVSADKQTFIKQKHA